MRPGRRSEHGTAARRRRSSSAARSPTPELHALVAGSGATTFRYMRWLCVLAAAACARASPAGPLADRAVASKSLDEVKMMLTELEVDYAGDTSDIGDAFAERACAVALGSMAEASRAEDVADDAARSRPTTRRRHGRRGRDAHAHAGHEQRRQVDKEEVKAIMKGMADEVTQNFMAGLDTDCASSTKTAEKFVCALTLHGRIAAERGVDAAEGRCSARCGSTECCRDCPISRWQCEAPQLLSFSGCASGGEERRARVAPPGPGAADARADGTRLRRTSRRRIERDLRLAADNDGVTERAARGSAHTAH